MATPTTVQFIPPGGLGLSTPIGPGGGTFNTLQDLADGIASADQSVQTITSAVNAAEQNITSLSSAVDAATQNITSLSSALSTAEQGITSLTSDVGTAKQNIASLSSAVAGCVTPGSLPEALSASVSGPLLSASPSRRFPLVTDDQTRGAAVGDPFINPLGAWQAVKTDAGSAVWARRPVQISVPAASAIPVSPAAAWGIDAVVTGFAGSAFDVTIIAGGNAKTTTLSVDASGRSNRQVLAALVATCDAGTYARITKMYDQTGGTNHLTSIVAGRGPIIGVNTVGHSVAAAFNQTPNSAFDGLHCATLSASCEATHALALFGSVGSLNENPGNFDVLACCVSSANTTNYMVYSGDNRAPAISAFDYLTSARTVWANSSAGDADAYGFSRSNTTLTLYKSGKSQSATLAATTNTTGTLDVRIGPNNNAGGGYNSPVIFTGAAFYPQALTAAQWSALRSNYVMSVGASLGPRLVNIMAIGDSRTVGYLNPANYNFPARLPPLLPVDANIAINAVSGITTVGIISNGPLDAAKAWLSALPSAATSIVVLYAGVNDQAQIGNDPVAISGRISQILTALFAGGLDFAVLMAEKDQNLLSAFQTVAQSFGSKCVLINPFAGTVGTTGVTTGLFWPDGVHPTPSGDDFIASYVAGAISTYLPTVLS